MIDITPKPMVGRLVVNFVKANLFKDRRKFSKMSPYVRIQLGELHNYDSNVAKNQGKTPFFEK